MLFVPTSKDEQEARASFLPISRNADTMHGMMEETHFAKRQQHTCPTHSLLKSPPCLAARKKEPAKGLELFIDHKAAAANTTPRIPAAAKPPTV